MKVKYLCLGGLVAALLGLGEVRGQGPSGPMPSMSASPADAAPSPPSDPAAPHGVAPGTNLSLSSWIEGPHPAGCCGPVGGDGPIGTEVYLRTGLAFPIGGGFLNSVLDVGWEIEGGARALFFNPQRDAAWVIDTSISHVYNTVRNPERTVGLTNFPIMVNGMTQTLPTFNVSVASVNRTYVNLAGGREWYLMGSPDCREAGQVSWRAGIDGGGSWGTEKMNLNQTRHRTDTIGGVFVAAHTDVEVPCGCRGAVFLFGVRGEWSYTWSDILQHQNLTDLTELTVLFNAGLRY
jgi:hypothetical protein